MKKKISVFQSYKLFNSQGNRIANKQICLIGALIYVLPRAPDSLKTALPGAIQIIRDTSKIRLSNTLFCLINFTNQTLKWLFLKFSNEKMKVAKKCDVFFQWPNSPLNLIHFFKFSDLIVTSYLNKLLYSNSRFVGQNFSNPNEDRFLTSSFMIAANHQYLF